MIVHQQYSCAKIKEIPVRVIKTLQWRQKERDRNNSD